MEDGSTTDRMASGMRSAKLSFLFTLTILGIAALTVGLIIGFNEAPWGFVIAGVGLVLGVASSITLFVSRQAHRKWRD